MAIFTIYYTFDINSTHPWELYAKQEAWVSNKRCNKNSVITKTDRLKEPSWEYHWGIQAGSFFVLCFVELEYWQIWKDSFSPLCRPANSTFIHNTSLHLNPILIHKYEKVHFFLQTTHNHTVTCSYAELSLICLLPGQKWHISAILYIRTAQLHRPLGKLEWPRLFQHYALRMTQKCHQK